MFIERRTLLKPRAQPWSNYKKHNTFKFIIGILYCLYIKRLGRNLTENCGLLSKLLPGGVILADRGFTLEQSIGMCLKYCLLQKANKLEVDSACQLAQVRIHVERVIGVLWEHASPMPAMHMQ